MLIVGDERGAADVVSAKCAKAFIEWFQKKRNSLKASEQSLGPVKNIDVAVLFAKLKEGKASTTVSLKFARPTKTKTEMPEIKLAVHCERRGIPPFKLEVSGTANETMEISDVRIDPWLKFSVRYRGSNCANCQWHWTAFDGGGAPITRGVVHYRGKKKPGELASAEIITGQGFAKVARIEIDYR